MIILLVLVLTTLGVQERTILVQVITTQVTVHELIEQLVRVLCHVLVIVLVDLVLLKLVVLGLLL